jgi:hypothetical protein
VEFVAEVLAVGAFAAVLTDGLGHAEDAIRAARSGSCVTGVSQEVSHA